MIYLIMGPSCVGKTTVGLLLAEIMGGVFIDADNYHSNINIEKMKRGISLTDYDRKAWISRLNHELFSSSRSFEVVVLACSALKNSYRESILKGVDNYIIINLIADLKILEKRSSARKNHFFNAAGLSNQLSIYEPPSDFYINIDAEKPINKVIEQIIDILKK